MDATPSSALSPNLRTGGLGSRATISLTALVALGFFISVALPYLLLDPTVLARFGRPGRSCKRPVWGPRASSSRCPAGSAGLFRPGVASLEG
jgi:hypothetical protein